MSSPEAEGITSYRLPVQCDIGLCAPVWRSELHRAGLRFGTGYFAAWNGERYARWEVYWGDCRCRAVSRYTLPGSVLDRVGMTEPRA